MINKKIEIICFFQRFSIFPRWVCSIISFLALHIHYTHLSHIHHSLPKITKRDLKIVFFFFF